MYFVKMFSRYEWFLSHPRVWMARVEG